MPDPIAKAFLKKFTKQFFCDYIEQIFLSKLVEDMERQSLALNFALTFS